MKKLMLAIAFVSLGLTVFAAQPASAATINQTVHIAARGAVCETQGYITPENITVSSGDLLNIRFKNEQPTKLEVMGIPGGTFLVPGNSIVERNFTATGTFEYSTWLQTQDCVKAKAHITTSIAKHAWNFLGFIVFMAAVFGAAFYIARKRRNRKGPGKQSRE